MGVLHLVLEVLEFECGPEITTQSTPLSVEEGEWTISACHKKLADSVLASCGLIWPNFDENEP